MEGHRKFLKCCHKSFDLCLCEILWWPSMRFLRYGALIGLFATLKCRLYASKKTRQQPLSFSPKQLSSCENLHCIWAKEITVNNDLCGSVGKADAANSKVPNSFLAFDLCTLLEIFSQICLSQGKHRKVRINYTWWNISPLTYHRNALSQV